MDCAIKNKSRGVMLWKNIFFSFLFKIINILCSLVVVPLTLEYLTGEVYGIWLALSSILMWFSFFDVGLGNGLRNYLTQAISSNEWEKGCTYISTTLALLSFIFLGLAVIFLILVFWVDWCTLFNSYLIEPERLRWIVVVAVVFTLFNFLLKNVGIVFMALQRYAMNDLLLVLGNISALFSIYLLKKFTTGDLLYVTMAFTIPPVIVFLLSAVAVFYKYPQLRPSISKVNFSLTKMLIGKGLAFFVIQITSCLVVFGASNLFIIRICGPEAVTVYNIAYKYFNIMAIGFTIVISPLWNAYTDAYVKGDMVWIKKMFRRTLLIWGISVLGGGIMIVLSPFFYTWWIGNSISISTEISFFICGFLCLFNLNNCATYLLNGLNMIKVQLYVSVGVTLLYLLLVDKMGRMWGVTGISACMGICYLIQSVVHLYQCRLIVNRKAKGIWIE
jgi:putative LPS biosynthesis related polysaccharide transporter/flippase